MEFKTGTSVRVRDGVTDPDDASLVLSGWQGRILDIDDDDQPLLLIEWDSITLAQLPVGFIVQSELDGLDWGQMSLYTDEVEICAPRDDRDAMKAIQLQLQKKYYWASFGEVSKLVEEVLEGVDGSDEMACLEKWDRVLEDKLSFPMAVTPTEAPVFGSVKEGAPYQMKGITHYVDMYGLIVNIRRGREKYEFPLCDLKVLDDNTQNILWVNAYQTWFGNR